MGDLEQPFELSFNDYVLDTLKEYGFYHLNFTGLNFFIAVTEKADLNQDYLINQANDLIGTGFVFKELLELRKLNEIDFTLKNWR
ncbi:hypothetical protein D3C86_1550000 [compost metagenome]